MVPSMSLFRPIAPALDSLPTNALADIDMDVYAASCNPPRRAKRLRSDSNPTFTPPQLEAQTSLSPSSSADQGDQDAYDVPQPPPPKRRGRKPGTLSRAAREAQRKINHSLIEKARRTKINDALATLRELVPPEYKRANEAAAEDSDDDEEEDPKKGKTKPKGTGEKEFKLEILVRTVAYLQDLTERIKELEEKGCPRCKEPIPCSGDDKSLKRKRESHAPKANSTGNGGHGKPCEDVDSAVTSRSSSLAPPTSRLPSISAWLPSSAEEQRSLLLTPSQSPSFDPVLSGASARPIGHQLPTPPTSTTFAPSTAGFSMPPVLTLPSPSAFLSPNGSQMQPRFSGFVPRANNKGSPLASPVYTPEDETAASLLLRISTSTSPQASFKKPAASRSSEVGQSRDDKWKVDTGYALTPSRLLGLTDEER
ncbi:hypothetical protein HYDPIDRAFT_111362 [Hydnomerulius pinastri MD-312]|uniref:BHLH domain-containing protein n=1 Tax=Hydnomerulius pinastri MD-312 TaxID=994086 RepID=A0A0C9VGR6_9AGAM|nr:hypothetical protein HYDPIDRAFT_111362 [Hydnomerulius pinastri MD-312]